MTLHLLITDIVLRKTDNAFHIAILLHILFVIVLADVVQAVTYLCHLKHSYVM